MKYIIPLLILALLLCCCTPADPLREVSDIIGVDVAAGRVLEEDDTQVGFHGDGVKVLRIQLEQPQTAELLADAGETEYWHPLPLSENLSAAVYGSRTPETSFGPLFPEGAVPPVEHGIWFFQDRHPQAADPADDSAVHSRASWNFTAAILDTDTSILYYLELDT